VVAAAFFGARVRSFANYTRPISPSQPG
jgi:hypothetical protein